MRLIRTNDAPKLSVNPQAYMSAHRVFAQATSFAASQDHITLLVGEVMGQPSEGAVFNPEAIVYFTVPHFRQFAKVVAEQIAALDRLDGGGHG